VKSILLPMSLVILALPARAQFTNLLEGKSLDQWQLLNGDAVGDGWAIEDGGILHLKGRGGNIATREVYNDFELWFEFRVSTKGNNGIKYRVKQYDKAWLGLEYQILDDGAFPQLTRDHLTGSLYDLVLPKAEETRLSPVGEWNVGKIRVSRGRTQHWVNGQLMIDQQLSGEDWKSHVADSKFRNRAEFGENQEGRIMLTDHNSETWFRNIFVRRLNCSK